MIGGGGLVLIPVLMSATSMPAVSVLATNKVAAILGTASAAATLVRRVGVPRVTWIYAFIAGVAAALGARAVSFIDDSVATPIILILLVGVGVFVALNPKFGQEGAGIFSGRRLALAAVAVAVVGGYDGVFGPGTGMFLIMAFTAVFTQGFVRSAAMAKALLVFGFGGFINWKLALALAVANVVGAQLGARTVLKGGSTLVRVALLGLVVTLCAKLGWDLLQHQ